MVTVLVTNLVRFFMLNSWARKSERSDQYSWSWGFFRSGEEISRKILGFSKGDTDEFVWR